MNIISNDCIAGKIYKKLGIPYQTPFVWNSIFLSDFIILMNNYKKLIENNDIKNINLSLNEPKFGRKPFCPCINLNNLLNIYFTHHIQDVNYKTPYVKGVDLYYYDILSYLKEKWLKRCEKIDKTSQPSFIIDDMYVYSSHTYTDIDIKNVFDVNIPYKKLIITTNKSLKEYENDKIKILFKEQEIVNTTFLADRILNNKDIKDFLEI